MQTSSVGGLNGICKQNFMRCDSKQCINNYQLNLRTTHVVLMTFEAKKTINLISKSGCPILHALKSISNILK